MEIQRIGRYDVKSLIGQGGMSAVYLGYDPRSQREVAIKILPPYYLHAPKFRERFEREALMIALLEHPAIVPVYDMGEEDGQPYIVMRYMSGGSLSDRLIKGPIPLRECMEMYLRLAPALDTAHVRGVIHRDVKPDNLLFDKYDNVYLSDFGLARLRETIGFANISDGSIMGTPAYMSPEQIQGDRELDGRSDIYSMGVVLYQMLCGAVPFTGTTAASVMMMHLVNPVPQVYEQNKSLPVAVQSVLDIAMAKDPKDRYQTAGEFARAIQAVTTGVHRKPTRTRDSNLPNHIPAASARYSDEADIPTLLNASPSTPLPMNGAQTPIPGDILPVQPPGLEESTSNQLGKGKNSLSIPSIPSQAATLKKSHPTLPWWGIFAGLFIILLFSLSIVLRNLGVAPFSSSTNSGNPPTDARVQNNLATPISINTVQGSIVPGKADKLAFLKSSDIWASNLDGTDLVQLTTDGATKSNLHWTPDGQSVIFTSTNCLNLVGLITRETITLTCITGVPSITAFDISPDGQQVALGLPPSDLYLLSYARLFNLPKASLPADLPSMAQCPSYAPYRTSDTIKGLIWSFTDYRLALLLSTDVDGIQRDEVSIFDFSQCTDSPPLVKEISPAYFLFTLRNYYDHPEISGLSWDGNDRLLLNGISSNSGFGDLQLFNFAQNQSVELTPNGTCCYRDAHWSPDGTYLFYTFQPEGGGDISLYYTPAASLYTPGSEMASLTLPADFFTGSLESIQPALRTAH